MRSSTEPFVVSHGEPHRGNVILTRNGALPWQGLQRHLDPVRWADLVRPNNN